MRADLFLRSLPSPSLLLSRIVLTRKIKADPTSSGVGLTSVRRFKRVDDGVQGEFMSVVEMRFALASLWTFERSSRPDCVGHCSGQGETRTCLTPSPVRLSISLSLLSPSP